MNQINIPSYIEYASVADEIVIMDRKSGKYFGLDQVGSTIWNGVASRLAVPRIVDEVVQQYNIDSATAERDIEEFIQSLVSKGVLESASS